ncbi:MAG: ABC transporter ATP-binding protein [Peptococcaceae bacterium]|nr:ABC transporter ATP-binding protein [Peptococcaceae bacterium]
MAQLLTVEDLHVSFTTRLGEIQAVRGISFSLAAGEAIAVVGESGCGKSAAAQSIMRLLPSPPARYTAGKIIFAGRDLLRMSEKELESIRGRQISMIFQDPMTSLNPTMKTGRQIMEVLQKHSTLPAAELKLRVLEMLSLVGFPDPAGAFCRYPHQISGGMRQKVMIAMALACNPGLLVADEPTTALDVATQAQILELIRSLQEKQGTAVILVTHNLAIVAGFASRVMVMYAGKLVETGPTREIFYRPQHPYTRGLLLSLPRPGKSAGNKLHTIAGLPPDLLKPPQGCAFWPRCEQAMRICRLNHPPETFLSGFHRVSCWLACRSAAASTFGPALGAKGGNGE